MGMPVKQVALIFNTFMRSKYKYGLIPTRVRTDFERYDDKWEELALRALVKTKNPINGKGRRKLQAMLKLKKLQWGVETEAARTVGRWKQRAEEDLGGKRTETYKKALQQVERLAPHDPPRAAWRHLQENVEEE